MALIGLLVIGACASTTMLLKKGPGTGSLEVRVEETLEKTPGRLHFARVRLEQREGEWWACSTGNQSSGVLTSMVDADALLIFPKDATRIEAGSHARVQALGPDFHASEARGF